MANITDQFVTSFSELFIGDKTAIGTVDYTDEANSFVCSLQDKAQHGSIRSNSC